MLLADTSSSLCGDCKQKTHLRASVGKEAELQSLGRAVDPNSKKTNKTQSRLMFNLSVLTMGLLKHVNVVKKAVYLEIR